MMIIMRADATPQQIENTVQEIKARNLQAHLSTGSERTVIGAIGDIRKVRQEHFLILPGVDRVVAISPPYKLASREFHPDDSSFPVNGIRVKRGEILLIAGPCSVESKSQILETAQAVREAGAHVLRGGAFKPRTSPYSFQGLEEEGLRYLAEARELTELPVITEVMSPETVPLVSRYADILQIGARNMQNYPLLQAAGRSGQPVLLKRGIMASITELLLAAEYILSQGNPKVMVCERGIRTFSQETRFTADINAIPVLKARTHLPVIFDPSHSTGHWQYVPAMALAGIAAGADGLMVEVHPHPGSALSDGQQSLKPEKFQELVLQVKKIGEALGNQLASAGENHR